uniref:Zinc finger and BTB domain containing 16 n=1 Tax=Callorhinchus milii TaxID=7868 RepID=A0A4W3HJK3_CALMI
VSKKMGTMKLQNPSHPSGLLHKANQMRLLGTLCDVVILVDSQEFHAHRTVLACTSKMFEILFHRNSQHYTLDFLSPKTFQQILEYAYTSTLQAKVEDLDDLLYAAEILEIEYLEEQCLKILETIQASEAETEGTVTEIPEEEDVGKGRYNRNLLMAKPLAGPPGYVAAGNLTLPGATLEEQSPSVSTSFGLSALSPTKAAVDSLMTKLQDWGVPGGVGKEPVLIEVKHEVMQVDESPDPHSPQGRGDKAGEGDRGRDGPGTPTRSSVITSARELHYVRDDALGEGSGEVGVEEQATGGVGGERRLALYPVAPRGRAEAMLGIAPSLSSTLHVQPGLSVAMDFGAYGSLLPQGFIQRELFSKLGQLAAGMKSESKATSERCNVCSLELPDNEAIEQHR